MNNNSILTRYADETIITMIDNINSSFIAICLKLSFLVGSKEQYTAHKAFFNFSSIGLDSGFTGEIWLSAIMQSTLFQNIQ